MSVALLWFERWYDATRTEARDADDAEVQLHRRFARRLEADFAAHHDARHYADALGVPPAALSRALSEVTGRATKDLILDRSVAFYQDAIGLQVHRRSDTDAVLGAGAAADLLELVEDPAARPAGRHAGLYHLALLHESREELARAVQRLALTRTPIEGASDHGVSEAIYLPDPDGNGLELYADRPRDAWPAPGPGERVSMYTRALDLNGLYDLVAGDEPVRQASAGFRVGHVHLHVSDLEAAIAHYEHDLGLELMTRLPSAAFLAWDGYHHHLGLNTWRGVGIPGVPAGVVGLRHFTVIDPSGEPRETADPSGNRALVVPAAGRAVAAL